MEEKNYTGIVPEQRTGRAIDAEFSLDLNDIEEAKAFFNVVKVRLLDVNNWHRVAPNLFAEFQVVDKDGMEVNRNAQKGDYFKIDIPGPGSKSGEGYDWAKIEEIENASTPDIESLGIRVRPAQNPQNNEEGISHFYSPESSSTFTVTRENNRITAAIYDRNTKINTETGSLTDKVRDAVVGAAGIFGFSKIQWKALTEGLLKKEN